MSDHAKIVRERVSHIARGCRAGTSHNPAVYENDINAALDALVADRDAWIKAAADNGAAQDAAEKERDRVLGAYHRENDGRLAAEAERDRLEADAEKMYAVLRDSLSVSSARVTELEAVLLEISEKKCLNGNSTCDWPCVVCRARAALGEDS